MSGEKREHGYYHICLVYKILYVECIAVWHTMMIDFLISKPVTGIHPTFCILKRLKNLSLNSLWNGHPTIEISYPRLLLWSNVLQSLRLLNNILSVLWNVQRV